MKTDLTQMEEENQRLLEEARVEMREIGGELVPVTVVPMGASGRKPRNNWRRLRPESGPVLLSARIRKHRTRGNAKPQPKPKKKKRRKLRGESDLA